MKMKNHQLLKDSNVQLKTIRQARMMADRLVDWFVHVFFPAVKLARLILRLKHSNILHVHSNLCSWLIVICSVSKSSLDLNLSSKKSNRCKSYILCIALTLLSWECWLDVFQVQNQVMHLWANKALQRDICY